MQVPASIEFEGKTLQLWKADQLENLSPENLRRRALDMRDTVGADRVPPLPRHRDGAIKWIMDLQAAVTQLSAEDFGQQVPATYEGYHNEQQPPTPSNHSQISVPLSSMAPDSVEFNGKSVTLWRLEQLANISDESLRSRALDMRDAVGADRCPVLPRHREGAIAWIMHIQSLLSQLPPEAFGTQGVAAARPPQQSPPASEAGGYGGYGQPPPSDRTDSDQAYMDARAVREKAQARNRGQGNPLW